jgi:hypothetical protein
VNAYTTSFLGNACPIVGSYGGKATARSDLGPETAISHFLGLPRKNRFGLQAWPGDSPRISLAS